MTLTPLQQSNKLKNGLTEKSLIRAAVDLNIFSGSKK
jgi:hypothetical protein